MEPEIQKQLIQVATLVGGVVFIGGLVAVTLVVTGSSRKNRRHRKVSAARRAQNTSYDLFAKKDDGEAMPSSGEQKQGRRSSRHRK